MDQALPGINIPYIAIATWVPVIVVVIGMLWRLGNSVHDLQLRVSVMERQLNKIEGKLNGKGTAQ